MSRSKSTRLREQQQRKAWKKRREAVGAPTVYRQGQQPTRYALPPAGNNVDRSLFSSASLGLPSLSDRLAALVQTELDNTRSATEFKNFLNLGALAWNLSELPEDMQPRQMIEGIGMLVPEFGEIMDDLPEMTHTKEVMQALQALDAESAECVQFYFGFITTLIVRKRAMFPNDTRLIENVSFVDLPGNKLHFDVFSVVDPRSMLA